MKPVEIAPGIFDVGVNDWNISDFHGYSTPFGTRRIVTSFQHRTGENMPLGHAAVVTCLQ